MNGDDYVIDGDLAFSNSKDALKFYQTEYRKQQTEIIRLQQLCESHIRSEYEGTSLLDGMLGDLYGKAQEK